MITCFHHYNILAKTYGRMTTALCFPASMTMVNACTQLRPEKSCRHYGRPCLLCCMLFNKFNFVLDIIVIKVPYITGLISVYHMAGSVSSQDDQRQLLCSDSATQILLRARIVTTRKKLFFQQYWYNYNYLLTARLVQSRTCFVFVCKNVEKNLPDIQRSHWSKLYMYWNYSVLYTNMWPPK